MTIPLQTHGKVIGSICLVSSDPARSLLYADLMFVELVVNRAALFIENARLYKEAKEAIRAREEIVAVVSHDLKNPLGLISISAQILEKRKPEGISDEAWSNLKTKINSIKICTISLIDTGQRAHKLGTGLGLSIMKGCKLVT